MQSLISKRSFSDVELRTSVYNILSYAVYEEQTRSGMIAILPYTVKHVGTFSSFWQYRKQLAASSLIIVTWLDRQQFYEPDGLKEALVFIASKD